MSLEPNNFIIGDEDGSLARQLVESAQASQNSAGHSSFAVQNPEGDDREEIKRILEYREIATDGDSSTALGLLQKLTEDVRYKSGYFGFRLHFIQNALVDDVTAAISGPEWILE
ncbi:hypothetical protein [Antarcticimicrobium luteum]|uniref:Uncharacterized protein n=1 Tax=Antarcticimicrobium luteum TaxID=2547397 RepID=A0A4R5VCG6_9RHOB|nr:hypothetical protein [Antarcticimicrobium luteum]TDK49801.1 hypothetical protein E1832_07920 [Antarcticimicrobium luteum]